MPEAKRFHSLILTVLACLVAGMLLFPGGAAAQQMSIAAIQITGVDKSHFPDMRVEAIIRDGNNNSVPDADIANLDLLENNTAVAFQHKRVTRGVEIMFVVDAGQGINNEGVTKRPRLEQMKDVIRGFTGAMVPGDSAGLAMVTSGGVTYPQPITSDQALLSKTTDKLAANPEAFSPGLLGIQGALGELSKSPQRGKVVQMVIFLSAGIQTGGGDLQKTIDQAVSDGVFVHTILVRDDTPASSVDSLKHLAADTRGLYTHYNGQTALKPLQDWVGDQRVQYEFQYHSALAVSSDRSLELRTRTSGPGLVADNETYQVTIQAPRVVLEAPASNTEITRKAAAFDTDMDTVDPTSVKVVARVEWPDGYPRRLTEAVFSLDNVQTGTALTYPSPDSITFDWDLRPYRSATTTPVQLEVTVTDEFDLSGKSDPVQLTVTVIIPERPASDNEVIVQQACEGLAGFDMFRCQVTTQAKIMVTTPTGWISIISMIIALVAVIFAIRFRGRIVEAGGAAFDVVRETITRLTRPGNTEVGAYLEVLRGDDTLTGKQIPLYIRTVTPAGRSPQEAELVFDMANERSVVSRRHCEFRDDDGIFKIRDLGSTHGTFVNGIRLPEGGDGQVLSDSDRIELGPVERGGVLVLFHAAGQFKPPAENDEDYRTNPAWQE